MTRILVDSDIVIDFLRTKRGALPSLLQLQKEEKIQLFLSAVTVIELFSGKSSKELRKAIDELIDGCSVVPLQRDLAVLAGEMKREHTISGSLGDLIIAASARMIGAELATRNKRHYQGIPKLRLYPLPQAENH